MHNARTEQVNELVDAAGFGPMFNMGCAPEASDIWLKAQEDIKTELFARHIALTQITTNRAREAKRVAMAQAGQSPPESSSDSTSSSTESLIESL